MAKSSRGGRRGGGGGNVGLNPKSIKSTSNLLLDTALDDVTRGQVVHTLKDFQDEYGLTYNNTRIAQLQGKEASGILAYYDGAGIAINSQFLDSAKMDSVYKQCVESGFHPSSGKKSGMEAVTAHELGHALTDMVGAKMGITGINSTHLSATAIVEEARKQTSHRGVVQMASKISGYATHSNAEAVAEAICDVYCNGSKAKSESLAIVSVVNKYLKN